MGWNGHRHTPDSCKYRVCDHLPRPTKWLGGYGRWKSPPSQQRCTCIKFVPSFPFSTLSHEQGVHFCLISMLTSILLQANSQPSPLSSPSSPASASSTPSGPEQVIVVTRWDQQGFPVLVTLDPKSPSRPASYDSRGGLITATTQPTATGAAGAVQAEGGTNTSRFMFPSAGPAVNKGTSSLGFVGAKVFFELAVWLGLEVLAAVALGPGLI